MGYSGDLPAYKKVDEKGKIREPEGDLLDKVNESFSKISNKEHEPIKVIELFAGVGGFRIALEKFNYKVVWANQYEPKTPTKQHANWVYKFNFNTNKDNHSEININDVDISKIPKHDMLVGGFPCQDFSVGALNKYSKGLSGKKGILWFNIKDVLEYNVKNGTPTKYVLLENVDRLLKCPTKNKGGDFHTILSQLNELGYGAEWKVINAADYGMPQKRRRIFILAYHNKTAIYKDEKGTILR